MSEANAPKAPVVDTTRGDSLIYEKVANILVEPLQAASVVLASGPMIIDSAEPVRVPTLAAAFDPQWVAENEEIPETASEFGELRLMPTERKSIKAIVRVSNELLRSAGKDVSRILETRLVADVKDKLDNALLTGDGSDDTVTGLLNVPGATRVAAAPDTPDALLDGMAAMASDELNPDTLFMSAADFYALRKIKDADGRPLMQPDVTRASAFSVHGLNVTVTNKLDAGTAIMADMSKVVVVRDSAPRVDILTERYAEYDQVGIRVVSRYDLGALHPEAVTVIGGN